MMLETAVFCLAMNIYHESRGEPPKGRKMVAYVTMERAGWRKERVCDVVFQPSQFSWANGRVERTRRGWGLDVSLKPTDRRSWAAAQNLARTVLAVGRPKDWQGATHYHADHVRPYWAKSFTRVAAVGAHVFYR